MGLLGWTSPLRLFSSPPEMPKTLVIINKYSGRCRVCGREVGALTGVAIKEGHCGWQSAHRDCEPGLSARVWEDREKAREAASDPAREKERLAREYRFAARSFSK